MPPVIDEDGKGSTFDQFASKHNYSTQATILPHELTHLYLPKPEGCLRPERYSLVKCMALSANESAINPSNYAFYTGGKLETFCRVRRVC